MDFNWFQWISIDFDVFLWISIYFNGFHWIYFDFNWFHWISMDCDGFQQYNWRSVFSRRNRDVSRDVSRDVNRDVMVSNGFSPNHPTERELTVARNSPLVGCLLIDECWMLIVGCWLMNASYWFQWMSSEKKKQTFTFFCPGIFLIKCSKLLWTFAVPDLKLFVSKPFGYVSVFQFSRLVWNRFPGPVCVLFVSLLLVHVCNHFLVLSFVRFQMFSILIAPINLVGSPPPPWGRAGRICLLALGIHFVVAACGRLAGSCDLGRKLTLYLRPLTFGPVLRCSILPPDVDKRWCSWI